MRTMIRFPRRTALLAAVSVLAGAVLTAAPATAAAPGTPASVTSRQAPAARELPPPPDADEARLQLAHLTVADEDDVPGYSRAKFPHGSSGLVPATPAKSF